MNMVSDCKFPNVRKAMFRLFILVENATGRKMEDGDMAELLQIKPTVFSYYKNGSRDVSYKTAKKFADILQDKEVLELFGFADAGNKSFFRNVPNDLAQILLEIQNRMIVQNIDPNSEIGKQTWRHLLQEYLDGKKAIK